MADAEKTLSEVLTDAANNNFEVPDDGGSSEEIPSNSESEDTSDSRSDTSDSADLLSRSGEGYEGADTEPDGAEAAAAEQGTDTAASSEGDDDGDDVPDLDGLDVKDETRERFNKILDSRKEFRDQAKRLQEELDNLNPMRESYEQLSQRFQQAGMTNEDMDFMLTVNGLMKSPNMNDRVRAAEMIGNLNEYIQRQIGHPTQNYDPLAEFPDLQDKVAKYQISEADAREMAQARKQQQLHNLNDEQLRQHEMEQQQARQVVQQAQNDVLGLEQQWQSNDPDYKSKEPHILEAMKDIMQNVHPTRWAAALGSEYNRISTLIATQAAQNKQPPSKSPNAMRPSGSTGAGAAPEAKTMYDALSQGLREIRSGG